MSGATLSKLVRQNSPPLPLSQWNKTEIKLFQFCFRICDGLRRPSLMQLGDMRERVRTEQNRSQFLMRFNLKIWYLVATVFLIFLIINNQHSNLAKFLWQHGTENVALSYQSKIWHDNAVCRTPVPTAPPQSYTVLINSTAGMHTDESTQHG